MPLLIALHFILNNETAQCHAPPHRLHWLPLLRRHDVLPGHHDLEKQYL
jgi:hypothetical protein